MHRYSIIYMIDVIHMAIKKAIGDKKLNTSTRNHVVGQLIEILKTLGIEIYNDENDMGEKINSTDENFINEFLKEISNLDSENINWGEDENSSNG